MSTRALAAAAAILLLSVSTLHAVTYTRTNKWLDLHVPQSRFNCVTLLPIHLGSLLTHRVTLVPSTADADLYVYGYNGNWVYVGASANGGLARDAVTFTATNRRTYNTLMACAWGFGGTSNVDIFYDVGN